MTVDGVPHRSTARPGQAHSGQLSGVSAAGPGKSDELRRWGNRTKRFLVSGYPAPGRLWASPDRHPVAGIDYDHRVFSVVVRGVDPDQDSRGFIHWLVGAVAVPRYGAAAVVRDGEGAVGRWRGRRSGLTEACQGFRGTLGATVVILRPADPEA
jgi:hypothetical protein